MTGKDVAKSMAIGALLAFFLVFLAASVSIALAYGPQYQRCHAFQGSAVNTVGLVYSTAYHPLAESCVLFTTGSSAPVVLVWEGGTWQIA